MSERRRFLLIAAAAVLPHLVILGNPLLHDAPIAIVDNAVVQSAPLGQLWTRDFWGVDPKLSSSTGSWRPLVSATWALQARSAGNAPWLYHAGDLAIHAATTSILAALLVALGAGSAASTVAALLFAWHPVGTEAVASAVGRADMLATTFLLVAALAHVRGKPLLACAALAASLFCKETAVTGPFVLIGLAWFRGEGRTTMRFQACCLGVCAGYLALRGLTLGGLSAVPMIQPIDNPLVGASFAVRLANAAALLAVTGRLLIAPYALNHLYATGTLKSVASLASASAIAGVVMIVVLATVAWRSRSSLAGFGASMIVLPILPALHLVAPAGVVFAERWIYAAAAGGAALVAWALGKKPTRAAAALSIAVALLFAGLTVRRDLEWRSVASLVASSLKAYPGTAKVWNEKGILAIREGRTAEAIQSFEEAVRLVPDDPRPWFGLVGARERAGDVDGAEQAWRRLIELAPSDAGSLWVRFARWQWGHGRYAAARATLGEAALRFPRDPDVRQALASIPKESQ